MTSSKDVGIVMGRGEPIYTDRIPMEELVCIASRRFIDRCGVMPVQCERMCHVSKLVWVGSINSHKLLAFNLVMAGIYRRLSMGVV